MKTYIIAIICLFNAIVLSAQDDWVTVKKDAKGFKVDFPKEPKEASQDVPTDKGSVAMDTYIHQEENIKADNLIYMVAYTKYPSSFFEEGLDSVNKQDTVLNNAVNGAVSNTNGTLVSKSDIQLYGFKGKDAKISIEGGYVIKIRTILVGYQLYIMQTISSEGKEDNADALRFVKSFELTNVIKQ